MPAKYRVALYGAPEGFLRQVRAMFPNEPIEDDELQFVDHPTPDNHTHVIAFTNHPIDTKMSGHIPQQNCIGIALEPRIFLHIGPLSAERICKTLKVFICGARHGRILNSVQGYCLIPAQAFLHVPAVPMPIQQRLRVSLPLSQKKITPLHVYRHTLAAALLADPRQLPVHIWGTGAANFSRPNYRDDRVHVGCFKGPEPYKGYAYTVAVENRQEGMYFSEKVSLPMYYDCTPLYIGSPEIETFFPNGTIPLTGVLAQDVNIIARAAFGHLPCRDTAAARKYFQENWHWGRAIKKFLSAETTRYDEKVPLSNSEAANDGKDITGAGPADV